MTSIPQPARSVFSLHFTLPSDVLFGLAKEARDTDRALPRAVALRRITADDIERGVRQLFEPAQPDLESLRQTVAILAVLGFDGPPCDMLPVPENVAAHLLAQLGRRGRIAVDVDTLNERIGLAADREHGLADAQSNVTSFEVFQAASTRRRRARAALGSGQ